MSVVLLGSTSGSVTLQEPAVAGSTVIDLPATSGTMAVLPTATSVLPEANGGTGTTVGYNGFKNRLINSAMVISQRNGTAVVTPTTSTDGWPVDRFAVAVSQNSKLTTQQNAGGLTGTNLPVGFQNYLGVTSSSAYSVVAADVFAIYHRIEGFNFADMQWGTTNAKTITLSFQVYSSLTGTFGGALRNAASNRSYPFTYTVGSANTWTSISITVAGDTTGTWVGATNGIGLQIWFGLGVGSTASGTAGAWAAANYTSATGATSVVGTSGATFYITGVQLEKGSTATSFDYRPYGTELALCQRYYESIPCSDEKRTAPTMPVVTPTGQWVVSGVAAVSANAATTFTPFSITTKNFAVNSLRNAGGTSPSSGNIYLWEQSVTFTASAEL